MNRVHIGTFDSERFWDDDRSVKLPSLFDPQGEGIVLAMDELLFPFARKDDLLITRHSFNPLLKSYLEHIGFGFNSSSALPEGETDFYISHRFTTPELLEGPSCAKELHYEPYSVINEDCSLLEMQGIICDHPSPDAVKKINSKAFSTELLKELGYKDHGWVVSTFEELEERGNKLLERGPFLIKEEFGVSGRGNLLIDSKKKFMRTLNRFKKQEGKNVAFVIEPFLSKKTDFSSLIRLEKDGSYTLLSIQEIINCNFGYQGSLEASPGLLKTVKENNYFEYVDRVVSACFSHGYWGNICIDSMTLEEGGLLPVVEINGRKSMGLINYAVSSRLSCPGQFQFILLGYEEDRQSFEQLLDALEKESLLFTGKQGILPLSAGTLFVNRDYFPGAGLFKGRFYFSSLGESRPEREEQTRRLKEFFGKLNYTVYS